MGEMHVPLTQSLQRQLWDRIDRDSRLSTEAGILVLAATDGAGALEKALGGETVENAHFVETIEQVSSPR